MRAVEELYRAYRDDVYRYLCSLTRDPAQAEDLLSETFLKALQGRQASAASPAKRPGCSVSPATCGSSR